MAENTGTGRRAMVVSLAAYRAARVGGAMGDARGRRLVALRLPRPRDVEHRRRMLTHLTTAKRP